MFAWSDLMFELADAGIQEGQGRKGVRWMPWHQGAMKDVANCEMPR